MKNEKPLYNRFLEWVYTSPIPFVLLGGALFVGYLFFFKLAGSIFTSQQYEIFLTHSKSTLYNISFGLFLISGLSFLLAIKQMGVALPSRLHWLIAIGFFVLFVALLLVTQPLTSQDIFWNLFEGKIFGFYHENPYMLAPQDFPQDPDLANMHTWKDVSMYQGPLWTLLVAVPGFLFPQSIVAQILLLRLMLFFVLAGGIAAITLYFKKHHPEKAFLVFLALAWQPLVLITTINDAHNDILVGMSIVFGLYFITKQQYGKGILLLWAGVLVKYVGLLLFPLIFLYILRRYKWKRALQIGVPICLMIVIITLLLYLPFGYGFHLFGISIQISQATTLSFFPFWFSLGVVALSDIEFLDIGYQNALPQFNEQKSAVFDLVGTVFFPLFFLGYAWLLLRRVKEPEGLFSRSLAIFVLYLLVAPVWFMAWYLLWIIPLAVWVGVKSMSKVFVWSALAFPYPFPVFYGFGLILGLVYLFSRARGGFRRMLDKLS